MYTYVCTYIATSRSKSTCTGMNPMCSTRIPARTCSHSSTAIRQFFGQNASEEYAISADESRHAVQHPRWCSTPKVQHPKGHGTSRQARRGRDQCQGPHTTATAARRPHPTAHTQSMQQGRARRTGTHKNRRSSSKRLPKQR